MSIDKEYYVIFFQRLYLRGGKMKCIPKYFGLLSTLNFQPLTFELKTVVQTLECC